MERGSDKGVSTGYRYVPWTRLRGLRLLWAGASSFVVESSVFALAVLPAEGFFSWHWSWPIWERVPHGFKVLTLAMAVIPAYLIFAVLFMILSASAMRLLDWRTPRYAELRIDELDWPLLDWARYAISIHLVRIFAGTFLQNTPLWAFYMRLNGARLGRRVFVNSLAVTDHNLLDFGDDVVIGADVHLSGHTVERGVVKTAPVRLGDGVTVGVGANIEIGVDAGPGCQIGALSAVPKFARLDAGCTYVGIPAHKLEANEA